MSVKQVGRYAFRIVTDGKFFKPQMAQIGVARWWWSSMKPLKWEDMTRWGVPLEWAKEIIDEQVDVEERAAHGWVEVEV